MTILEPSVSTIYFGDILGINRYLSKPAFDYVLANRAWSPSEIWTDFDPSTRWDRYQETGKVSYFFVPAVGGGFIPYPTPRYALTGGMQPMQGGV